MSGRPSGDNKDADKQQDDLASMIACHDCDVLYRVKRLPVGRKAFCGRCGASLYREKINSIDRTLALAVTGLVLFVLANTFPFLGFEFQGKANSNRLISGVGEFMSSGLWGLAVLVFLTSILLPLLQLLSILALLLPLKMGRIPRHAAKLARLIELLRPWAMMEVYMLGVFVAIVKLSQMAVIDLGIALWAFSALILIIAAMASSYDGRLLWHRLEGEAQ